MSFAPVPHGCRAFLTDFSAFIDGDLPPDRRDEYQAHVDCCESCLAHLAAYRRGITVLKSLEEVTPVDLWTRLEQRLWVGPDLAVIEGDRGRPRVRRIPGVWRSAVALAAVAVLALVLVVRGLDTGTPPGETGLRVVRASVGITVPEVPSQEADAGIAATRVVASRSGARRPRGRSASTTPTADPVAAVLARAETGAALERELDRLREEAFRGTLGPAAGSGLEADGWVEPVRLNTWSRTQVIPASLVRPSTAVRPAPWNVDRAVSLP